MNTQNRYIDFEVRPCVLLDFENEPATLEDYLRENETTRAEYHLDATFDDDNHKCCYTVFGVLDGAGCESIADYLSQDMAESLATTLRQGLSLAGQLAAGWSADV